MWSGPRNISTALMRSFENRPDTFVSDEPFYAHYLAKSSENHPLKQEIIKTNITNYNKIIKYITGDCPSIKKVWYQKHMAQHILPKMNLKWTENFINCFLIRNPKNVIISYSKKNSISSVNQLGFPQQSKLYYKIKQDTGYSSIVIDSKDILVNP